MPKYKEKKQTLDMKRNKAVENPDVMMPRRSMGFANCPQKPIMKEFSCLDTDQMFAEESSDDADYCYELKKEHE